MRPFVSARLVWLALALLVLVPTARADPIEWSYSSFVFPSFVRPDNMPISLPPPVPLPANPSPPNPGILPIYPSWPGAGITFQSSTGEMVHSSRIVVANMYTSWFGPGEEVARYSKQPFQLTMGILDKASNRSQVAIFTGYINGTYSATGSNLEITFPERFKMLHIGHNLYKIDINQIVAPGQPGGGSGSIGAMVKVHKNPEPSTLLLLGLSGPVWGLYYWRRRR
jgi:hypothetical protein